MIELSIHISGQERRRYPVPNEIVNNKRSMERLARVLRFAIPIIAREGSVLVLAHCPYGVTRIIANMKSRAT